MSGFAYVLGKFYFGFAYVLGKSCIFAIQIYDITIMIHRLLIEDLTEWGKRKNRKPLDYAEHDKLERLLLLTNSASSTTAI